MTENHEHNGEDTERLLVRYLDGELSDREAAELERRVETDGRLGELLRQYASLDGRLAELREHTAEGLDEELQRADIVAALERKVLLEGPSHRRRIMRFRPVAVAAAAVVAIAVTVALMLPGGKDAPPSPAEPFVHASLTPMDFTAGGEGFVEARPLPMERMQMRLSPESRREVGVPSGTVYVSSGSVRTVVDRDSNRQYPLEWTLTETY